MTHPCADHPCDDCAICRSGICCLSVPADIGTVGLPDHTAHLREAVTAEAEATTSLTQLIRIDLSVRLAPDGDLDVDLDVQTDDPTLPAGASPAISSFTTTTTTEEETTHVAVPRPPR